MIIPWLIHISVVVGLGCLVALFFDRILLGVKCKIWPLLAGGIGFFVFGILVAKILNPPNYNCYPLIYAMCAGCFGGILADLIRQSS